MIAHLHANIIDQSAIDILKKYFIFDQIFNLIEYDCNIEQLYNELKLLKRDEYEPNYRFIFLHYDTEYYIVPELAGITMINLQKILQSLDISNYFCLVLTQQELQSQCQQVNYKFNFNSCSSIATIPNVLHKPCHVNTNGTDIKLNANLISQKYISLNRVGRFHRRVLIALLKYKNLLQDGIVSYNTKIEQHE
jgi:hypothetical protein